MAQVSVTYHQTSTTANDLVDHCSLFVSTSQGCAICRAVLCSMRRRCRGSEVCQPYFSHGEGTLQRKLMLTFHSLQTLINLGRASILSTLLRRPWMWNFSNCLLTSHRRISLSKMFPETLACTTLSSTLQSDACHHISHIRYTNGSSHGTLKSTAWKSVHAAGKKLNKRPDMALFDPICDVTFKDHLGTVSR